MAKSNRSSVDQVSPDRIKIYATRIKRDLAEAGFDVQRKILLDALSTAIHNKNYPALLKSYGAESSYPTHVDDTWEVPWVFWNGVPCAYKVPHGLAVRGNGDALELAILDYEIVSNTSLCTEIYGYIADIKGRGLIDALDWLAQAYCDMELAPGVIHMEFQTPKKEWEPDLEDRVDLDVYEDLYENHFDLNYLKGTNASGCKVTLTEDATEVCRWQVDLDIASLSAEEIEEALVDILRESARVGLDAHKNTIEAVYDEVGEIVG